LDRVGADRGGGELRCVEWSSTVQAVGLKVGCLGFLHPSSLDLWEGGRNYTSMFMIFKFGNGLWILPMGVGQCEGLWCTVRLKWSDGGVEGREVAVSRLSVCAGTRARTRGEVKLTQCDSCTTIRCGVAQ